MSLFSIRRQMDDLMNQMMYSTSHMHMHHTPSLFDNDPFFNDFNTPSLLMIDNDNNNNNNNNNQNNNNNNQAQANGKQEINEDKNIDKNKPKTTNNNNNTSLTTNNNNNNSSLSIFNNRQWAMMKCDVHEEKDKFIVSAELPGVSKDQVKVHVSDGYLTISGDKKEEKNDVKNDNNGREIRRSERRYGEFKRSFRLPETADFNNINAKFDNGVLNLNIPKLEKQTTKQQQITIN